MKHEKTVILLSSFKVTSYFRALYYFVIKNLKNADGKIDIVLFRQNISWQEYTICIIIL